MNRKKELAMRELISQLQKMLCITSELANTTLESANPSRGEPRYDATREEASRLYNAFAKKAYELESILNEIKRFISSANLTTTTSGQVVVGSLVKIELANQGQQHLLILPCAGGHKINLSNEDEITTISVGSPVGLALLGRKVGEEIKCNDNKVAQIIKVE